MVKIRTATRKDFDQLLSFAVDHMKYAMTLNDWGWESMKRIREGEKKQLEKIFKDRSSKIFIAQEKKIPIGYVSCRSLKKSPYFKKREGSVDDLYIEESFRKKGVGKLLMKTAIDYLKSKGAKTIALKVTSNNVPAVSFYGKLGFKEVVKSMELRL